ncbi:Rieske [2Fe-2S] domain-containing protein [Marinobacter sp. es.048]|uniref:aromatic ring-hydroxylating oxygenase subunit alpha n=1 Tax=Marinobacter sp. es.048 TaxID=1761795 RepID=UPI000B6C7DC1|nr:aromatic ring-hydroxylating dioxygenase subunit alpha [Marinobacter sp. es.048]SNC62607.1 Rieske [2Fe-2S] domain-containing protein [Marinobacter sp. es.048]
MKDAKSSQIKAPVSKVSPSVEDLFDQDSRPLPVALKSRGNYEPGLKRISPRRYYDPAVAKLEKERLWLKTWQFACREEDIPEIGDRVPYDVGDLSFFIVRSAENKFKAFYNTCLHRGTRLCDGQGGGEHIRCPFHGWEWNTDGSLHHVPSAWDFPIVTDKPDEFRLPEAQVATWGGFIFINPDPDARPFEPNLGVLPEHFRSWEPENHFTYAHVSKRINANWKVALEAFLESYHVVETHSDALPFTGDVTTQYDIWDDGVSHISRLITPLGVPSVHLGDEASREAALQGVAMFMAMGAGVEPVKIDSAEDGRSKLAEWRRQTMGTALQRDFSHLSDAELVDTVQYFMFPNFCPWYGEGLPLVYQFLPYGDDPNQSVMNIRILAPVPGNGAPRPPSAQIVELGLDDPFTGNVPEFGALTHVVDQDMVNMPSIQKGLKGASRSMHSVVLGRYQECRIAHFHEVLGKVLGLAEGE